MISYTTSKRGNYAFSCTASKPFGTFIHGRRTYVKRIDGYYEIEKNSIIIIFTDDYGRSCHALNIVMTTGLAAIVDEGEIS